MGRGRGEWGGGKGEGEGERGEGEGGWGRGGRGGSQQYWYRNFASLLIQTFEGYFLLMTPIDWYPMSVLNDWQYTCWYPSHVNVNLVGPFYQRGLKAHEAVTVAVTSV